MQVMCFTTVKIVALRNEKGSYNPSGIRVALRIIVALRNEKGSYNYVLGSTKG